jgi:hypothetical protein
MLSPDASEPVEFGHKVFLAESGKGLVTEYRMGASLSRQPGVVDVGRSYEASR